MGMDIITRQQAITLRLDRYYTGVVCKRLHNSERYTVNSCCIECLHPKFISANREAKIAEVALGASRVTAKRQMVRVRVAIDRTEMEHYAKVVLSYATLRASSLRLEDVRSTLKPKRVDDTLYLYAFWMFPQDVEALRLMARDLNWRQMSPESQTAALLAYAGGERKDNYVPPPFRG